MICVDQNVAAKATALSNFVWQIAETLRGDFKQSEYGKVILAAEDDRKDTIKPRIVAAGADPAKFFIVESLVLRKGARGSFNIASDLHLLTELVTEIGDVKLLILDPIGGFIGTSKEHDSFRDSDVRAVLGPVKEWAGRHDIAVVIVAHFRKGGTGRAIDRVMGSLAFTALSRSAWAVIEETDAAGEATGRKLMAKIKQNVTAGVDALAFEVEGVEVAPGIIAPRVVWREAVAGAADDLLPGAIGREAPRKNEAGMFLVELLADGPVKAADVKAAYTEAGFSDRTMTRIKRQMNVVSHRENGVWFWSLEASTDDEL